MISSLRRFALATAAACWVGSATSKAQEPSLGGYGGSTPMVAPASPGLPYSGSFGGFMPFRMGGGARLVAPYRSRSMTSGGSSRSPFRLSNGGGMNRGALTTPMMKERRTMSVMPPSFGSPFRQPAIFGGEASGSGMPM